jgi:hypothetical protein
MLSRSLSSHSAIQKFKLPSDIHYRASLVDGTVTDNTYLTGSTQTVVPHTVGIKGWKEALLMMVWSRRQNTVYRSCVDDMLWWCFLRQVEGDKYELYCPAEFEPDAPVPEFLGQAELTIFQIELVSIKEGRVPVAACQHHTFIDCKPNEIDFIRQVKPWNTKRRAAEAERLEQLPRHDLTADKIEWIERRAVLLREMNRDATDANDVAPKNEL